MNQISGILPGTPNFILDEFFIKSKAFKTFKNGLARVFTIMLTEDRAEETVLTEVIVYIGIFKVCISICPFFKVDVLELHILCSSTLGRNRNGLRYDTSFVKV